MNLYLLTRAEPIDYDETDGAVVAAQSPAEARRLANAAKLRPLGIWHDPRHVKLRLIGTAHKLAPGVVLESFNAG